MLVESICKTILKDRKYPCYDDSLELPKLVKYTAKKLKLTPENYSNTKVEQSFIQVKNGMATMIHGLCEIRNLESTASHGKDGYKISLYPLKAYLLLVMLMLLLIFYLKHTKII